LWQPVRSLHALAFAAITLGAAPAAGEHLVRELPWGRVRDQLDHESLKFLSSDSKTPYARVEISGRGGRPTRVRLLTIEKPPVRMPVYAVVGMVRCEGVEGKGYLEMWSEFPGGGRYYSRTLAASGPMQSLEGTQGWRQFVLPFYGKPDSPPPESLTLIAGLPGRGTLVLGEMRLLEYAAHEDPLEQAGQWWGDRAGGLIGGILGALVGCLGGAIGLLSSRGKARRFVLATMGALVALGIVLLLAGLVAVLKRQPYAVCYPLLLLGFLCTVVVGGMFPRIRKRYAELELRHMDAQGAA